MDVVDDVFVKFAVQNFSKFLYEPATVVFVDGEDRIDDLADEGGSLTLSSTAFVITDN